MVPNNSKAVLMKRAVGMPSVTLSQNEVWVFPFQRRHTAKNIRAKNIPTADEAEESQRTTPEGQRSKSVYKCFLYNLFRNLLLGFRTNQGHIIGSDNPVYH